MDGPINFFEGCSYKCGNHFTCEHYRAWNDVYHFPLLCQYQGHDHPWQRPDIDPEKLYSFTCDICRQTERISLPIDAQDINGRIFHFPFHLSIIHPDESAYRRKLYTYYCCRCVSRLSRRLYK